jgi:RHS repeat-associated protein
MTTTQRGFVAQTEDDTTGLNYLNNRYHDPALGVFISVDPLVSKTGEPYLYASGNPTTLSDPSGLEPGCGATAAKAGPGACGSAHQSADTQSRINRAVQQSRQSYWDEPSLRLAMCSGIRSTADCDAYRATLRPVDYYPESEGLTDLASFFHVGPLDVIALLACRSDQACQIGVLEASRSDITGGSLKPIEDTVLDQVLYWAGAVSSEVCGASGGAPVYCIGVTRLPSRSSRADALTIGHFVLYDLTEENTNYLQSDGTYSLATRPNLLAHEFGHVPQWEQFGSSFLWLYLQSPNNWECLANAATGTTAGSC